MALIYLYSHDGDGMGHLRRSSSIAQMIVRKIPDASCLLMTGSPTPSAFGLPPRCDHLKIPTLLKTVRGKYESPLEQMDSHVIHALRKTMIENTVKIAPPDLLIVDKHPQGLNGELLPTLRWLKSHAPNTRIVLGLRDILDEPEKIAKDWKADGTKAVIEEFYHHVWIYSDERIIPTADTLDFNAALHERTIHTGFVVTRSLGQSKPAASPQHIVASVGGGRDGFPTLVATLRAAMCMREAHPDLNLRLFTGPLMSEVNQQRIRNLLADLGPWVKVEPFSRRYLKVIRDASLVVTMGGYNSVLECVALGKPTIVVPREIPRSEQLIRARVFENLGAIRTVRVSELEYGKMESTMEEVLSGKWKPRQPDNINFQGYRTIIKEISEMLRVNAAEVTPCVFEG